MGIATEASGRNQGSSELQGDPEGQQLLSKGVKVQAAGLKPTPELTAIAMGARAAAVTQLSGAWGADSRPLWVPVYFVQGILGLARLATTFLFKDEFHLEPATVRGCQPWLAALCESTQQLC